MSRVESDSPPRSAVSRTVVYWASLSIRTESSGTAASIPSVVAVGLGPPSGAASRRQPASTRATRQAVFMARRAGPWPR